MPIDNDSANSFYANLAAGFQHKNVPAISSALAPGFSATALDGTSGDAKTWADVVKSEFDGVNHSNVQFKVNHVTPRGEDAEVGVTREFRGKNSKGQTYQGTVDTTDTLTRHEGGVRLKNSRITGRNLSLDGKQYNIAVQPQIMHLVQGCGDDY